MLTMSYRASMYIAYPVHEKTTEKHKLNFTASQSESLFLPVHGTLFIVLQLQHVETEFDTLASKDL